jgi:hypothetical protein|tara:strand:+ start:162 stop:341 length:180 start_codon:yes stop_codon:yes gene_type:complete
MNFLDRDFLEEMKKEEELTNISLKESKKAKKERQKIKEVEILVPEGVEVKIKRMKNDTV